MVFSAFASTSTPGMSAPCWLPRMSVECTKGDATRSPSEAAVAPISTYLPRNALGFGRNVHVADCGSGLRDGRERHQPCDGRAGDRRIVELRGGNHVPGARDGTGERGIIGGGGRVDIQHIERDDLRLHSG